jgi:hypothetical protein
MILHCADDTFEKAKVRTAALDSQVHGCAYGIEQPLPRIAEDGVDL